MKKLKIGIFLDNYYPSVDGVVLVVDNLATELAKYNDVTVVIPYTDTCESDFDKPYKIIRISSIPVPFTEYRLGKYSNSLSKEYRTLVKEDFDIIHIHSPFTIGNLGLKVAKKLNVPCIATMHTRFDFEIRKFFDNDLIVKQVIKNLIKVYNKCDKCIAINNAMIKVFEDYGYKYTPTVIYNGTDLKPLKNVEENIQKINHKFNLEKDETVFLFVGRITSIKNIFFILDSLKLLKEDNYKFKMIYVGSGPDEVRLKKKIKEYKMENEVITTGRIMNRTILSAIYKRAKLFLFPSLFDASSLVQIEAAVNETPGLFIENSVTADTVTNNVNGFTCELDTKKYKDKIKEIMVNPKKLQKVSINARKMLGKSWQDIAKETYKLYLKEIEKKDDK